MFPAGDPPDCEAPKLDEKGLKEYGCDIVQNVCPIQAYGSGTRIKYELLLDIYYTYSPINISRSISNLLYLFCSRLL
jgi:hypothetical protein